MRISSDLTSGVADFAAFVGLVSGLALCVVALLVADMRGLAIPAMALIFPSLLYGLR
jgi:hypothetical protein